MDREKNGRRRGEESREKEMRLQERKGKRSGKVVYNG